MITEDYVSFETAKLLKEKGFEGFTLFSYSNRGSTMCGHWENEIDWLPKCTLQMAMKWLREVHNICIVIEPHAYDCINEKNSSYEYSLWQGDNYYENPELKSYPSYEEAVEAALKYCLENLI